MRVAVLNGPNLNLLGTREPEVYGTTTLQALEQTVRDRARELRVAIDWSQTNHEGELVDLIQGLRLGADGAIINAAALTHTSLAIRDAVLAVQIPFVEVHLSNIFSRDEPRRRSMIVDLAIGVIAGFGARSYVLGLEAMVAYLESHNARTQTGAS